MIKPIFTEKSLNEAKIGRYTFNVAKNMSKFQIKAYIKEIFNVNVSSVKTANQKENVRRTIRGTKVKTSAFKKAVVVLKPGEKISLWDAPKKEAPVKAKQTKKTK